MKSKRDKIKSAFWLLFALGVFGALMPVEISFFREGGAANILTGLALLVATLLIVAVMAFPFVQWARAKLRRDGANGERG